MFSPYDTWKLASPPEYDINICEASGCDYYEPCSECGLCVKHCLCNRPDELEGDLSDRLYDEWRERMIDDVR